MGVQKVRQNIKFLGLLCLSIALLQENLSYTFYQELKTKPWFTKEEKPKGKTIITTLSEDYR
jgi:hypothetical protein